MHKIITYAMEAKAKVPLAFPQQKNTNNKKEKKITKKV